jgi:hypothetical protein
VEDDSGAGRAPGSHSGKHRSGAERQPFAGNLHARMAAARPVIPFLQKLL